MYGATQPGHLARPQADGDHLTKMGPLKEIVFSALLVAAWRSRGASVGPGCLLGARLRLVIFGEISGICKTRIQQQQTAAAEFGTFLLKTAMGAYGPQNSG